MLKSFQENLKKESENSPKKIFDEYNEKRNIMALKKINAYLKTGSLTWYFNTLLINIGLKISYNTMELNFF